MQLAHLAPTVLKSHYKGLTDDKVRAILNLPESVEELEVSVKLIKRLNG